MSRVARKLRVLGIALAMFGAAGLPRPAEAFFCFSFSIGGGPRYSYWAPSGPFGQWYGPTVDYPGSGYGGYPGTVATPWNRTGGWGGPWSGAYRPGGWGAPTSWQASPWATPYSTPWTSPITSSWPSSGFNPYLNSPFGISPFGLSPFGGW